MAMAASPSPTEEEISRRLRLGEDTRTEFKSVARSGFKAPKGLAKAIAAMANTEGGCINYGIYRRIGICGCYVYRNRKWMVSRAPRLEYTLLCMGGMCTAGGRGDGHIVGVSTAQRSI